MWKHIIGSPTSPKRMIWDAIGGVMILWEAWPAGVRPASLEEKGCATAKLQMEP